MYLASSSATVSTQRSPQLGPPQVTQPRGRSLHQFCFLELFLHLIHLFCKLPVGGYDLIHCIHFKNSFCSLAIINCVHCPCSHLLNQLLPSLRWKGIKFSSRCSIKCGLYRIQKSIIKFVDLLSL